jgi:hypothetical protein
MVEITVCDASGFPEQAYLSLRVGEEAKQCPFAPNSAFRFERCPASPAAFELDVLQRVGSVRVEPSQLEAAGEPGNVRGSVEVPRVGGEDDETRGLPMRVSLQMAPVPSGSSSVRKLSNEVGVVNGSGKLSGKPVLQYETAKQAKAYLDIHSVQNVLQRMVVELLQVQPEEPFTFMCRYLQQSRACLPAPEFHEEVSLLVPKPPEEPRARPRASQIRKGGKLVGRNGSKLVAAAEPEEPAAVSREEGPGLRQELREGEAEEEEDEDFILDFSDVPGLGPEEYPGFPADVPPEEIPDLSQHCNAMAEVLTADPSIYPQLKDAKTVNGVSLAKCIKPGVDSKGHPMIKAVGLVAGDAACYDVFQSLFVPVVQTIHNLHPSMTVHPTDLNWLQVTDTSLVPPGRNPNASVRVQVQRNLTQFRMPPACDFEERRRLEELLVRALRSAFAGLGMKADYLPLMGSESYTPRPTGMSEEEEDRLESDGLLFQEPDAW